MRPTLRADMGGVRRIRRDTAPSHLGYRLFTGAFFFVVVCIATVQDWIRIGEWHVSRFVGSLFAGLWRPAPARARVRRRFAT